ncbi:MAG: tRNA uridine-5-carboxymethylaminomethyl(34) synthesis GTPase MnmE, partial [Blautia sp.]|nr:tRNA uridine-5-carboxymethylaminomethyl(34) synthesis GTPase MnmE [Blautia sp.]
MEKRTIAAISTAVSTSGIGIVRVSGPRALEVVQKVYASPSGKKDLRSVPSHTVHYGYIQRGEEICDEVLVVVMKAPHTYTREDTAEINCHGGILSMKRVLDAVLDAGASLAEPGEFTKKAFFNGRIDLSQAEAVMDLIEASSDLALENSLNQVKGSLRRCVESLRGEILEEVARIEASLDDPEHLSLEGYGEELAGKLSGMQKLLKELLDSFDNGRLVKEGIRTAIIGKPNVGKSSLLNLLLGQEKAIVTQIPGTTRDVLEDTLRLGDITLRIMDTAGIRQTEDVVEQIGVQRAKELVGSSDLILYVADSSLPFDQDDEEILSLLQGKEAIIVYNKTDLPPLWDAKELEEKAGHPVVPL